MKSDRLAGERALSEARATTAQRDVSPHGTKPLIPPPPADRISSRRARTELSATGASPPESVTPMNEREPPPRDKVRDPSGLPGPKKARTPRLLRPRQTRSLAVAPVVVTDLSAAAVVGLERRSFRELVRDLKIPHVRRGQRILVDVEVLREVLASASTRDVEGAPAGVEGEADENQGPTATELLQRLGRTRVVGG
jgi:hypothetical protein